MRAITRGQGLSPDHHPKPLRRICRRPSEGEKRRFADFQKCRDASATALGIDPTLIASRGMLSDLAYDWDKHASQLMNWQRGLLKGQELTVSG
jgi:ribonuclease D